MNIYLIGAACWGVLLPQAVSAWESHMHLMPWVFSELKQNLAQTPGHPLNQVLLSSFHKNPEFFRDEQKTRYEYFAQILLLNPESSWNSILAQSTIDLLVYGVDDPDQGMDRNLPDSADPKNERKFMGGSTGPSSQGFRHMYFGGWTGRRPLATFQIPAHALGESPARLDLLANEAKKLIQQGDHLWGMRILAWSMHYAQDLTQPFHTVQVPSFKIVPWRTLFQWPPTLGFESLVKESTRTIGNYHRAYEHYVREELQKGEASRFQSCLSQASPTLLYTSPRDLGLGLAELSVKRGRKLGNATYDFFGPSLMDADVDLIKNPDSMKLDTSLRTPESQKRLDELTCESLQLAKASTLWLLRWAFHR